MTKSEKNYWRARSYAFKLDPNNYRDLVHDTWLTWYKYKKTDLFEEDNKVVIACVKRRYYNSLYGTKYRTVNKEIVPILFSHVIDDYEPYDQGMHLNQVVLVNPATPEIAIIRQEESREYERKYGEVIRKAMELYGQDKSLKVILRHFNHQQQPAPLTTVRGKRSSKV